MAAPTYPSPFTIYDEHFYQLNYDPEQNRWVLKVSQID
jgi:hypothetical protein